MTTCSYPVILDSFVDVVILRDLKVRLGWNGMVRYCWGWVGGLGCVDLDFFHLIESLVVGGVVSRAGLKECFPWLIADDDDCGSGRCMVKTRSRCRRVSRCIG